jgi:glycosyltransferase involved in cell wall biosynthesis
MLDQITPLLLTYNEAPNIGRTLDQLRWARRVVVVDSYSDDATLTILAGYQNVSVFQRRFDTHAQQWNFGLLETGIETPWIMALDADYFITEAGVDELRALAPPPDVAGYSANFLYCVNGCVLRGSAYPPVTVLYRRGVGRYQQDGHTQRIEIHGRVLALGAPIMHDDRKPLRHWVSAQERYMHLEAAKLRNASWQSIGWADRLRRLRVVAPFVMLAYCLFIRGGILDGRAGIYYAFQRTFAELMLSLSLLEGDLFGRG